MRKEHIKEVKEVDYFCDRCGHPIVSNDYKICCMCNKEICTECRVLFDWVCDLDKPNFQSERPTVMCEECWDLGRDCRDQIMCIRGKAQEDENNLRTEWKNTCKEYDQDKSMIRKLTQPEVTLSQVIGEPITCENENIILTARGERIIRTNFEELQQQDPNGARCLLNEGLRSYYNLLNKRQMELELNYIKRRINKCIK